MDWGGAVIPGSWFAATGTPVAHAVWLTRDGETLAYCLEVFDGRVRSRRRTDRVCAECWYAVEDQAVVAK